MKKILIVIQLIRRGGVELVAINFARSLDPRKFDVTFLLINPNEHQDEELARELIEQGYKIESVPREQSSYLKKYKYINNFLRERHFDIVHSHVMFFSAIVLKAAKNNGIKVRAAHSHAIKWNSKENLPYKIYKWLMRILLNKSANVKIGCCRAAGEFLFGKREYAKNGIFTANAVDTGKFAFNEQCRADVRGELGIGVDELLVGHVGTIYRIKNQTFLVEIFSNMLKKAPNAKLLFVGEMVDTDPVIKRANELGVYDRIIMTGQRSDIASIYSALDIMIFPSLHEALPVSLIEAQASALPCLISDTVTNEVGFNRNVAFNSLGSPAEQWSEKAFELLDIERSEVNLDSLINAYDIENVSRQLENIYLSK